MARSDSATARIAAVAGKETIDIIRDRRAILVTLITAIVAGPVMMLLVLNLVARQADRVREMTLPIVGGEHAPALVAFLERQQVTLTLRLSRKQLAAVRRHRRVVVRVAITARDAAGNASTTRLRKTYSAA